MTRNKRNPKDFDRVTRKRGFRRDEGETLRVSTEMPSPELVVAPGIAPYLWQFTRSARRTLAYTALSMAVAQALSHHFLFFPALFCAASVLAALDVALVRRSGEIGKRSELS